MGMKIFEASGTFKPSDYGITADMRADIIAVGGGGGGSNGFDASFGLGGNSGQVNYYSGKLDIETSYPVTVGSGGVGGEYESGTGTTNRNGSNGTTSSFGSLLTAQGGTGGGVTPSIGSAKGGDSVRMTMGSDHPGTGGAGGFEPNYDKNFSNGGGNNTPSYTTPYPCSGDSLGNGGGIGSTTGSRAGMSANFGGNGGSTEMRGGDGNRGAIGGNGGGYSASGGGGGGGYGAGGGGGGYHYQDSNNYVQFAGGKGADGVVIVFW